MQKQKFQERDNGPLTGQKYTQRMLKKGNKKLTMYEMKYSKHV